MKKILIILIMLSAAAVLLLRTPDKNESSIQGKPATGGCGENCNVPKREKATPHTTIDHSETDIQKTIKNNSISVAMFYSRLCPHCDEARAFLSALDAGSGTRTGSSDEMESLRYSSLSDRGIHLKLEFFEVLDSGRNRDRLDLYSRDYGITPRNVPVIFIGDRAIEGFQKESTPGIIVDTLLALQGKTEKAAGTGKYTVPVLGTVDSQSVVLPLFTVTLGFLDGLNPCAMWVLVFLLGILAYSGSRRRMLTVGITFVAASGAVYFALMAAWLNLFIIMGINRIIMVLLACIAILMGLINLKEILFFKQGVSLMIPDSAKPGIYKKVRAIMKEKKFHHHHRLNFPVRAVREHNRAGLYSRVPGHLHENTGRPQRAPGT